MTTAGKAEIEVPSSGCGALGSLPARAVEEILASEDLAWQRDVMTLRKEEIVNKTKDPKLVEWIASANGITYQNSDKVMQFSVEAVTKREAFKKARARLREMRKGKFVVVTVTRRYGGYRKPPIVPTNERGEKGPKKEKWIAWGNIMGRDGPMTHRRYVEAVSEEDALAKGKVAIGLIPGELVGEVRVFPRNPRPRRRPSRTTMPVGDIIKEAGASLSDVVSKVVPDRDGHRASVGAWLRATALMFEKGEISGFHSLRYNSKEGIVEGVFEVEVAELKRVMFNISKEGS